MTPVEKFASGTKGQPLPPGPKVALELADGSYAVKVQAEGEVGYLHVGSDWVSKGVLLTLDEISRLRAH